jgi:hypothetical protein
MSKQSRLYPLLMKPGIQRDGTSFQSDYCIDGQWMRFQRGRPRKIGGYIAIEGQYYSPPAINLMTFSSEGNAFWAVNQKGNNNSSGYVFIYQGNELFQISLSFNNAKEGYWLMDGPVSYGGQSCLLLNFVYDRENMHANTPCQLYLVPLINNYRMTDQNKIILPTNDSLTLNGGMRLVPPFLFVWGMKGAVAWSDVRDIKNFDIQNENGTSTPGLIRISNDKVIQGHPIRGGAQSPAILFWTMNSLVRLLNVSPDSYDFKVDVISKNVSILSRLSVVEYDGLFFWPGTDRFFVYNGTVQEVPNTLNLNWFFDNVDMSKRQQVVGVRNQKYGEIWWFYPDKRDKKSYNTRALIYNKQENTWYDTKINRDAAWYDDASGVMFAAGQNLAENGEWQVWQHEQGTVEQDYKRNVSPIPASLQTPVISWASVGPQKEDIGLDRQLILTRLEPDFKMEKGFPEKSALPSVTASIQIKQYAQDNAVSQPLGIITPATNILSANIAGRQMSPVFSSNDHFEMGNVLLQFDIGPEQ